MWKRLSKFIDDFIERIIEKLNQITIVNHRDKALMSGINGSALRVELYRIYDDTNCNEINLIVQATAYDTIYIDALFLPIIVRLLKQLLNEDLYLLSKDEINKYIDVIEHHINNNKLNELESIVH